MITKNIKINLFIRKKGDIVMMVRHVTAAASAFVLMISICTSLPLLAADAQTANKPKDMLAIATDKTYPNICTSTPSVPLTHYAYNMQVMDDLSLTPFSIPAGYKFIVTHSTSDAIITTGTIGRAFITAGLNADVAVPAGATICISGYSAIVHGHLEKDIP